MDNRGDIREFLTSRRDRLTPQQAGLPDFGGRRRVKGLRREEVALLAGMSTEYYVRLERGNASGVSEAVLNGISRALRSTRPSTRICTRWSARPTRAPTPDADGARPALSGSSPTCRS